MNNTKASPVGLDVQIQNLQEYLYDRLSIIWTCSIEGYGRVYSDNVNGSIIPRWYNSDGEYKDVLHNDTIKGVHFFFIENDYASNIPNTNLFTSNVDLIVIVDDITSVKPNVVEYADEEILADVRGLIKKGFEITSVTKGENALDGFDISKVHFVHPYHVFKISMNIDYKPSRCVVNNFQSLRKIYFSNQVITFDNDNG